MEDVIQFIRTGRNLEAMTQIVHACYERRRSISRRAWTQYATEKARDPEILNYVHRCKMTRRSFERPRGYPGDAVMLLGDTRDELSGSSWADAVHHHLGGLPPMPDLAAEKALGEVLIEAARRGLVSSAHDLSDGGLAQGLVVVEGDHHHRFVAGAGDDDLFAVVGDPVEDLGVAGPGLGVAHRLHLNPSCTQKCTGCRVGAPL